MNTKLEKSLIKEASFSSITQRLANDLQKFSSYLMADLSNQGITAKTFIDIFNSLGYVQKQILIKGYSESSFPLLAPALNANMGASNESATILFDFLLEEGFRFNNADLKYIKKNNNFAFKHEGSFGHVYEVTWYYPLNKWIDNIKDLILRSLNKSNSPLYFIQYPSSNIKLSLIKHYEKLPKVIQSLVLRHTDAKETQTILVKMKQGSGEDLNFFKNNIA